MPRAGIQSVGVQSGTAPGAERLFDTTYEGAWRVLFKGAEAPASVTEDRGFRSQRQADEVSDSTPLRDTCFS